MKRYPIIATGNRVETPLTCPEELIMAYRNLYYICHKDNLRSILDEGICSRAEINSRNLAHQDIHDPRVLERRHNKKTLQGKALQEYVNLYFQPRNAMLYRLVKNTNIEDLAVLEIKTSVLDAEGALVSNRNAAANDAEFFPAAEHGKAIDRKILQKEYWTDSDDTKQRMMAEALVPNKVEPSDIMTIYQVRSAEKQDYGRVPVSVDLDMFFQPAKRWRVTDRILLVKGDMFFSESQTFTISVNLKGVMGKGLASRTKYQFPDAYVRYQDDCRSKKLRVGRPTLFKRGIRIEEELADDPSQLTEKGLNDNRWFLFLATKRDWKHKSRLSDIEASMQWLVDNYEKEGITSIALPALGCGLGGLPWTEVGPMMCRYLSQMKISSRVYLPMEEEIEERYLRKEFLLAAAPDSLV